MLYTQTIRQIDNYGQTPTQLFDKPHPERIPVDQVDFIWPIASIVTGVDTMPKHKSITDKPLKILCYGEFKISSSPILLIMDSKSSEKLIIVLSAVSGVTNLLEKYVQTCDLKYFVEVMIKNQNFIDELNKKYNIEINLDEIFNILSLYCDEYKIL